MRFFYDTEFIEDSTTIDLVSIGIVAEDGREFYAVSSEFDTGKLLANRWLVENVWPSLPKLQHKADARCRCVHGHLDKDHPDVRPRAQIARAVRDFLLADGKPELWADYAAYDHVALCQLWGTMGDLPDGMPMFTHDIQQEAARLGIADLPQQIEGLHDARADARHCKARFGFLVAR